MNNKRKNSVRDNNARARKEAQIAAGQRAYEALLAEFEEVLDEDWVR